MSPLTLKGALVAIKRHVITPDHPRRSEPQVKGCACCEKREAEECQEENIARAVISPTVLYRVSKVFRRDKAFGDATAAESAPFAYGKDCDNNSYSESECSLATTDNNRGAGWAVDKYFYRPVGLWVENKFNRVLGPYFVSPYVIGNQLTQAFVRDRMNLIEFSDIEKHLHKHEFMAFLRLLHDAR